MAMLRKPATRLEAFELLNKGLSQSQIARELNIPRKTLYRWIQRMNDVPTTEIGQEVADKRREIEELRDRLTLRRTELGAFESAIATAKKPLAAVATDAAPLDLMEKIFAHARTEAERAERLKVAEESAKMLMANITANSKKLEQMEAELAQLLEQQEWFEKYEPHVERFRHLYKMPQEQVKAIAKTKDDIGYHRDLLAQHRKMLAKDPEQVRQSGRYFKSEAVAPMIDRVQEYERDITALTDKLIRLQQVDESHFRKWLKVQVNYQNSQKAIAPQVKQYNESLTNFSNELRELQSVVAQHPELSELAAKLQSIDVSNFVIE